MRKVQIGCVVLLMAVLPAGAGKMHDFSRYEVILQRQPFGVMAAIRFAPLPTTPSLPVDRKHAFIEDIHLFAMTEGEDGVYAGFMNAKRTPVKHYYMKAGEKQDGILVVDVVYEAEKALLRKGDEQFWAYMPGASPDGPATSVARELVRPGGTRAKVALLRTSKPFKGTTRAEYLKGRAEGRIAAPVPAKWALSGKTGSRPPTASLTPEQREKIARAYNMELIRAGGEMGVPLPLQLTPEEDAQLVSEGVLPPSSK